MNSLFIRKAAMDDARILRALYAELEQDAVRFQPEHFVLGHRTDDFFRNIIDSGNQGILVAEAEAGVVGFAHVIILRQKDISCLKPQTLVYIQDMAVAKEMRGRGIGSKLIEACVEYGKKHGADFVRTQVFPGNADGLRFYEKCGFCEMMKTVEIQLDN